MQDEIVGRAGEGALDEIVRELPLGVPGRHAGAINVAPLGVLAGDEPLRRHDLQGAQHGGVGQGLGAPQVHALQHLANRRRAPLPQHPELDLHSAVGFGRDAPPGKSRVFAAMRQRAYATF